MKIKELADSLNKKMQERGLVHYHYVKRIIDEADKVVFEGSWPTGKPFREETVREDTEE